MSRKQRLHIPGGFYHAILRGNAGEPIFFDDDDRHRFYLLLQEGVERYGHRIHAFCLMTNHVHLAVQIAVVPLSKIMQNASFRQALAKADAKDQLTVSITELIATVCDGYGIEERRIAAGGRLAAEARGVAALFALKFRGCSLERLAVLTGRDASTLSSAARRITEKVETDKVLAHKIDGLYAKIADLQA